MLNIEKQILEVVLNIQANQLDMIKRLDRIEIDQKEMKIRLERLEQRVGALEQRVGALEQRIGALEERVGVLEQRVGALEQKVEVSEQKVDTLFELRRIDSLNISKILEVQAKQFEEFKNVI